MWKPLKDKTELAGELLFATNRDESFFVQFSKTPFPLATAQVAGGRWQIEFGADERSWRGRGEPPARLVWFQLPRAFGGGCLHRDWKYSKDADGSWRLENSRTGETLEGKLFP